MEHTLNELQADTDPYQFDDREQKSDYFAVLTEPEELITKLEEKVRNYYSFLSYSGLSELWYLSRLYYYSALKNYGSVEIVGDHGEYALINLGRLRNNLQHLYVMTTKSRPKFEAISSNTDYRSQVQATILGAGVLDYYMKDQRVDRKINRCSEYSLVYGEGFVGVEWNPYTGKPYDTVENSSQMSQPKIELEGDLDVRAYTPRNVIREISSKTYDESDWIITRRFINKYVFAEQYHNDPNPELYQYIIGLSQHSSVTDTEGRFARSGTFWMNRNDDIAMYTFYHKSSQLLPFGRMVKFVDGMICSDTILPYKNIPVFRETSGEIDGLPFGYTPGFDMLVLQEQMDYLYSVIVTNQRAFGVQSILVPRTCKIDINAVREGMAIIEYNSVDKEKPEPLNLTQTPNEIFGMLDRIGKDMDTIAGLSEVSHGEIPSAGMSGSALLLLESRTIEFNSPQQQSHIALMEDVGTEMIEVLKSNVKSPRIIRLAGKSKKNMMEEFQGDDLKDINRVICNVGNPITSTTAGRMELANLYLERGVITVEQHLAFIETGNLEQAVEWKQAENLKIRQHCEIIGDAADISDDQYQSAKQMLLEVQGAGAPVPFSEIFTMLGIRVVVLASDNHILAIKEYAGVISSPEIDEKVAFVGTLLMNWHIWLLKTTDPALLAALGQPSLQIPGMSPEMGQMSGQPSQAQGNVPPTGVPAPEGPQGSQPEQQVQPPNQPTMPEDLIRGEQQGDLDNYQQQQ